MRRAVVSALVAVLAALAGGCGSTTEVREPDLVVSAAGGGSGVERPVPARDDGRTRISVITHGQASSAFWAIVRNGVEAAARETDIAVTYRSPDTYSIERMRRLINDAVDSKPDGLVVSVPSADLTPAIRRAVLAGIPVVSINSGSDLFRRLGVLAHVGQPEDRAGAAAAERLLRAGVRRALCVNQEVGNVGLDLRCRAFAQGMRAGGGTSTVVPVDTDDVGGAVATLRAAMDKASADGMLTLGSNAAEVAMRAARTRQGMSIGTFDLSPEVLQGLRQGNLRFAIDQQAYLQGYLPVIFLGQYARFGLFPSQGDVIPTGPNFVTRENATQVMRLSRRGIR